MSLVKGYCFYVGSVLSCTRVRELQVVVSTQFSTDSNVEIEKKFAASNVVSIKDELLIMKRKKDLDNNGLGVARADTADDEEEESPPKKKSRKARKRNKRIKSINTFFSLEDPFRKEILLDLVEQMNKFEHRRFVGSAAMSASPGPDGMYVLTQCEYIVKKGIPCLSTTSYPEIQKTVNKIDYRLYLHQLCVIEDKIKKFGIDAIDSWKWQEKPQAKGNVTDSISHDCHNKWCTRHCRLADQLDNISRSVSCFVFSLCRGCASRHYLCRGHGEDGVPCRKVLLTICQDCLDKGVTKESDNAKRILQRHGLVVDVTEEDFEELRTETLKSSQKLSPIAEEPAAQLVPVERKSSDDGGGKPKAKK